MVQITKDDAYDAVPPDDFPAMIEAERYGRRTAAFDRIISATHDHFWDPLDKRYIDFDTSFDIENVQALPDWMFPFFLTDLGKALSPKQKILYVSESNRWSLSSILHGEQGALALSASLCHILKDPGAQEYAANQTREEARHVTAFSAYIKARWGTPLPAGPTLVNLLTEIVLAREVYKKIVGMQMLVEGLAMGAFATLYQHAADPLLVKLCQLVMTDEAFHHKFGKIWASRTIPLLSAEEHALVEDWAANCFQTLLFNLINPEQQKSVYEAIGVDWQEAQSAILAAFGDDQRREQMKESANIFRVLIKTLLNAGIITERTRAFYAMYVDMEELKREGHRMVGDDIAEDGIRYLQAINFGDASKGASLLAAE
ncbi:MAG: ferritin-like domain-containing protein [Alphaproteobacteria bacterium]|nr:ferritin-like domain-containing protein [Alphaproteobacteria bacterium]